MVANEATVFNKTKMRRRTGATTDARQNHVDGPYVIITTFAYYYVFTCVGNMLGTVVWNCLELF